MIAQRVAAIHSDLTGQASVQVNPVCWHAGNSPHRSKAPVVPPDPLVHRIFKLSENYTNSCNPPTIIRYSLSSLSGAKLHIYNILGQLVDVLVNEEQSAEKHNYELFSGAYFYKREVAGVADAWKGFVETKSSREVRSGLY